MQEDHAIPEVGEIVPSPFPSQTLEFKLPTKINDNTKTLKSQGGTIARF